MTNNATSSSIYERNARSEQSIFVENKQKKNARLLGPAFFLFDGNKLFPTVNTQHNPHQEGIQHGWHPAIADKGQGDSHDWQYPQNHPEIIKELQPEKRNRPDDQQSSITVSRSYCNHPHAQNK